ncbi:MAG: UDP-N-acetylglucosamine--N-acetylmuramyl-(pentapeptide) pyrophosphoryl-undecaprenol N-acetylglucosamine transferase [Chloroflexi bacterium]|nr:UDP-N-acetylglucosamine--N-acetylmuramyl-(pentapeptide) pyrophosphoryl-undecaprenol N-acetylglucosamine transferase [Chloroflexota bacterium]
MVISGGGTGGHIYPALAVASALRAAPGNAAPVEVFYLHGPARIDAEVLAYAGLPHRRLDVGPIRGTAPHRLALNSARLVRAVFQAGAAMRSFRPHVVLATGGYVSAPTVLAAALRRVPVVLYLPDATPGVAIRAFAPLARRIALSFPITKRYFRGSKAIVTGYPVRPEFLQVQRTEAKESFGLGDDLPVLMVMGGSTGAHSLNRAVSDALEPLLHHAQVIHLCGELDEQRLREQRTRLDESIRPRYHLFRYLHRGVAEAMATSDLIVCRAGASALAELPILRLPAVVVPHPFGHQDANADFLVEHGAAVKLLDRDLPGGMILPAVLPLLEDHARREAMATAMARLARPEAADNIASLVRSVARRRR